jgi:hypothetical protein
VAAVLFEVELAFEGVVDRLDHLPQRLEQARSGPRRLAGAGRAQQRDAVAVERALKLPAAVVPVGDHRLPRSVGSQRGVGVEDAEQHIPLVGLGAGDGEADRQPVQGAEQVQPEPPEVAGVAGAVAVLGPAGQR